MLENIQNKTNPRLKQLLVESRFHLSNKQCFNYPNLKITIACFQNLKLIRKSPIVFIAYASFKMIRDRRISILMFNPIQTGLFQALTGRGVVAVTPPPKIPKTSHIPIKLGTNVFQPFILRIEQYHGPLMTKIEDMKKAHQALTELNHISSKIVK